MNAQEKKPVKKKGPIRFEAVIPVTVIMLATMGYFSWFFDQHLKSAIEYVATQANGAEVNVASVKTSFLKGSFDLNGFEVTDKEQPSRNLVSLDNVHFQYMWDALLRMKFVVDDASINQIQVYSPRKTPGRVLPPEPASPSKLDEYQKEVLDQVKNEYAQNMLGDLASLLEGADPKDQLEKLRGELKSEARIKEMIADVNSKQSAWKSEVTRLSDTTKLKSIEKQVQSIKAEKNILKQAQGAKDLADLLKQVQKQAQEVQTAGKKLEGEVQSIAAYPKEVQNLVKDDIANLKGHFKIPQIDVKDMAMALFSKEFGQYIAKARKYQALAKQYLPEKKEREEVLPQKRATGKTYEFPITKSYPLFWLKRAAISSKGTKDSYSGNVSGELTNVTTSPKWVKKPIVLDVRGDFPAVGVHGMKAVMTADFTRSTPRQMLDMKVNAFDIPEKMFSKSEQLKFGFTKATGSTALTATMESGEVKMSWNGTISKPVWFVEAKSKLAQELLTGITDGIPVVYINGTVEGKWKQLKMNINSNLGEEIANGMKAQVGKKIAEAEGKIQSMIDEKIKGPQTQLMSSLGGNGDILSKVKNLDKLYKDNEDKIKAEIENLKKGGTSNLKEEGKKLLKKFKL
ncbi:MAG: TIGR03545 family protein [Bacteriovoracaceae bacterium]|nr:TIGR03545 family protein [Bacteriovoracaceae bacterium]